MNHFGRTGDGKVKTTLRAASASFLTGFCTIFSVFLVSCEASAQANSAGKEQVPFVESSNIDPSVPTPESVIGFPVGEKAVSYEGLVRYLKALSQSCERVTLTNYGKTHEGRTLYYLTITSGVNHKRLDRIKADNARLSDPRKLRGRDEAEKIIEKLPAIAWLNYSIHGDELSSTDAAIYVAYHLAAAKDKGIRKLLDEVVIHINPLMNPDGRERFLGQINQMTGVVSNPDLQAMHHQALWSRGRGNHYLFDLNRDWLVRSNPEVRLTAEVILSWNPHLLVDSHEQSAFESYLFDPPNAPINIHLSEKNLRWRERFGRDQAKAFNKYGWSYYTKDWYSEWSPIYANAWANLLGAIGLLYEEPRADSATVKDVTGRIMTYRETVHHHIVSTFANLETLRDRRKEILRDFFADRKWAVSEQDKENEVFILPPHKDTARWKRFVELIKCQGIEIKYAQMPFEAEELTDIWGNKLDKKQLPAGTVIVKSAQPHSRMVYAVLEFDPHFENSFLLKERKELENHRETLIYDVSAWNLPMAFGLEAYWAKSISDVQLSSKPTEAPDRSLKLNSKGNYGYLIDFTSSKVYPVLARLFDNKCYPRVATRPFQVKGKKYQRGTILLRGDENPANLFDILQRICSDFVIDIQPVDGALVEDGPDLGSSKFKLLSAPRVAIASQWPISSTSFGSVWYLLDYQVRLRCSVINIQNIGSIDMRTYNVLVLPDCGDLDRALNEKSVEKIKKWVEDGGTLIAIGNSAAFAADKDRELSSVRLRRDVLDKLDEYEEGVQREKSARDIKIDPNEIWGTEPAEQTCAEPNEIEKGKAEKSDNAKAKEDIEKLKRTDEWNRMFSPYGVFLAGIVDTEHWLGFGLEDKMAVFFSGSRAFMSQYPVATVVRLADENHLRLSGLLWPEARQRIANTAYVAREPMGRGQLILFATDPTFRMWLPAAQRVLLNGILLGPGMGSSEPMPW